MQSVLVSLPQAVQAAAQLDGVEAPRRRRCQGEASADDQGALRGLQVFHKLQHLLHRGVAKAVNLLRQQGPAAVVVEIHPLRQHQPDGLVPVDHPAQLRQDVLSADGQRHQRHRDVAVLQIMKAATPGDEDLGSRPDQLLRSRQRLVGSDRAHQHLPSGHFPGKENLADLVDLLLGKQNKAYDMPHCHPSSFGLGKYNLIFCIRFLRFSSG